MRLPGWMLVPEEDEDSEYEGAGKAKGKGKRRKKYQPVLESWVEERLVAEVVAEVRRTTLGEKPLVRRVRVGELTSEHVDTDEKVLVGQDGLFLEIDPEDISREEWPSLSNGRILGLYFGAVLDNDEAKAAWAAKYPLGGQGPQYPHYSVQVSKDGTRMAAEGPANSLAAANTKLDGRKIDEDEINAIFLQFDVWMPDKDGGGRWMPVAAQVALDDAFDVARNPHRKVLVHYGHTYAAENFQDVIKTEPDDAVRIESESERGIGLRGGGLSDDGPGPGRVLPEEWLEQLGTAVRAIEWPSDTVADYWREIARGELGFTEPRIPLHDPAAARARTELQRAMVEQIAHDLHHIDHELDENPEALAPVQNKIDDHRELLDTLEHTSRDNPTDWLQMVEAMGGLAHAPYGDLAGSIESIMAGRDPPQAEKPQVNSDPSTENPLRDLRRDDADGVDTRSLDWPGSPNGNWLAPEKQRGETSAAGAGPSRSFTAVLLVSELFGYPERHAGETSPELLAEVYSAHQDLMDEWLADHAGTASAPAMFVRAWTDPALMSLRRTADLATRVNDGGDAAAVFAIPARDALERVLSARWSDYVEAAHTALDALPEDERAIAARLASAVLEPGTSPLSVAAHATYAHRLHEWLVRFRGSAEETGRFEYLWTDPILTEMRSLAPDKPTPAEESTVQAYITGTREWHAELGAAARQVSWAQSMEALRRRAQARTALGLDEPGVSLTGEASRRRLGLQRSMVEQAAYNGYRLASGPTRGLTPLKWHGRRSSPSGRSSKVWSFSRIPEPARRSCVPGSTRWTPLMR
ncbi:hypothetical protein [Amycolatopsis sp. EV170708-02-1]|uniref:hypothetical protein n=1 Tax=Amycolatopsis sp. EV170708-02-1 TaxID=2919322 RepID=UPI00211106E3|nr:hypothetical protein [Amycolatopsis sp. EV170708-02-1]